MGLRTSCQKNLKQSSEAAKEMIFLGVLATLREQSKYLIDDLFAHPKSLANLPQGDSCEIVLIAGQDFFLAHR